MLRITWDQESSPPKLKLDGKLNGAWVEELRRVWSCRENAAARVIVDLTEVTFVGPAGRELLRRMVHEGAELRGSALMKFTIDRIVKESEVPDGNANRGD